MATNEGIEKVLADQIKTLIGIKADIMNAVNELAGSNVLGRDDTFASYADKIRGLDPSKSLDLSSLSASPGESYNASDYGVDGWNQVTVSGGSGDGSGSGSGGSGGGGGSSSGGWDDTDEYEDLPTYIVTFTNPEDPEFEPVEVEVKYKEAAVYTGPTPTKEGNYKFVKWDPIPNIVTSDMTVTAVFRDLDAEIADSWKTICENHGADYEIGEFKTLPIGEITWFHQWDRSAYYVDDKIAKQGVTTSSNVKVVMQKIYDGEDESTSTWLAKGVMTSGNIVCYPMRVIGDEDIDRPGVHNTNGTGRFYNDSSKYPIMNWDTSDLRSWLQNEVFNALPDVLMNSIKEVHKVSHSKADKKPIIGGIVSLDTLWIPSYSEVVSPSASDVDEPDSVWYGEASASIPGLSGFDNVGWNGGKTMSYWLRTYTSGFRDDTFKTVISNGSCRDCTDCNSRIIRLGFCL